MRERTINLTFHGVGRQPAGLAAGEAAVWVSRERFYAVLDSVTGHDDVRITFDDGNESDVVHALPALRSRGLTATFFVVAGRLGAPGYVDAGGLRELTANGMTIGCHGMRHRAWRALDPGTEQEELVRAKELLEAALDAPVTDAACPFGAYDRHTLAALRRAGYAHVYTSDRGVARAHDWLQPRNTVHRDDDAGLLGEILAHRGGLRRLATLTAKRWR